MGNYRQYPIVEEVTYTNMGTIGRLPLACDQQNPDPYSIKDKGH
jgi:hypothetical protein